MLHVLDFLLFLAFFLTKIQGPNKYNEILIFCASVVRIISTGGLTFVLPSLQANRNIRRCILKVKREFTMVHQKSFEQCFIKSCISFFERVSFYELIVWQLFSLLRLIN